MRINTYSLIRFLGSLIAFLILSRDGFYISRSKSPHIDLVIHRFYWKGQPIYDMADIDRAGGKYNTIKNGRTIKLD